MDRGKRVKGKSINYYLEGNFNARIGREGGRVEGENMENMERKSEDAKMNKERRKLCGFLEEQIWSVFNENCKGDEEGE